MSPHRLFRSPTVGVALFRSPRPLPDPRRRRFGLFVARLEDRTLLSGSSGDVPRRRRPGQPSCPSRALVVVASSPQGSLTTSTRGASRKKPSQVARRLGPAGIDRTDWRRCADVDATNGRRQRRRGCWRAGATDIVCGLCAVGRLDIPREGRCPRDLELARLLEH